MVSRCLWPPPFQKGQRFCSALGTRVTGASPHPALPRAVGFADPHDSTLRWALLSPSRRQECHRTGAARGSTLAILCPPEDLEKPSAWGLPLSDLLSAVSSPWPLSGTLRFQGSDLWPRVPALHSQPRPSPLLPGVRRWPTGRKDAARQSSCAQGEP